MNLRISVMNVGNHLSDEIQMFLCSLVILLFDLIFNLIYLFLKREERGEREGAKHQFVVAPHASPTGSLASNPGMCPDWESNWRPFGSQASTQSIEPHQPGLW